MVFVSGYSRVWFRMERLGGPGLLEQLQPVAVFFSSLVH
jgi:hypothetical protein